jgi:hypothetical protein
MYEVEILPLAIQTFWRRCTCYLGDNAPSPLKSPTEFLFN